MDGRDIGSVVFPDAEVKFFITADSLIRAKRRFIELNDNSITIDDVLMNLKERDFIDTTREESPLIQVNDAIVIDNSNLNQEQQLEIAFQISQKKLLTI
jgi:cytidylate kinase